MSKRIPRIVTAKLPDSRIAMSATDNLLGDEAFVLGGLDGDQPLIISGRSRIRALAAFLAEHFPESSQVNSEA